MSERVTVELPDELAGRVRAVAARARRGLEEVLVEWINQAVAEPPVEFLPDDQVLALCDAQMADRQQEELSELLARNHEGLLQEGERRRLDELMMVYRCALVRKAEALKTAVGRGLRPRLN